MYYCKMTAVQTRSDMTYFVYKNQGALAPAIFEVHEQKDLLDYFKLYANLNAP